MGAHLMGFFGEIPAAHAEETVTIPELYNADESYDGSEVCFVGEAIGDIIAGNSGHVWVTIGVLQAQGELEGELESELGSLQTNASVSVFMTREDAEKILVLGRYNTIGTTLEITGIFHLACSEHEGLSDVHASVVNVLDAGYIVPEDPDLGLLIIGGILILAGVLFMVLFRILRERLR